MAGRRREGRKEREGKLEGESADGWGEMLLLLTVFFPSLLLSPLPAATAPPDHFKLHAQVPAPVPHRPSQRYPQASLQHVQDLRFPGD